MSLEEILDRELPFDYPVRNFVFELELIIFLTAFTILSPSLIFYIYESDLAIAPLLLFPAIFLYFAKGYSMKVFFYGFPVVYIPALYFVIDFSFGTPPPGV